MADDFLKCSSNSNQPRPRVISHSRTISVIPKHHNNNISFMPKFLIKTFHRKKQHRRQCSVMLLSVISPDISDSISGFGENTKMMGDKPRRNNPLMKLIHNRKNVGSTISRLLRSIKKSSDHEHSKDPMLSSQRAKCLPSSFTGLFRGKKHGLIKSVNGKTGSEKSSEDSKPGNDKTVKKSMITIRGSIEIKVGFKIKGISRTKHKEKDEKRFELCKKKILMGEKCRPLDGNLRYDKNGILIPEDLT